MLFSENFLPGFVVFPAIFFLGRVGGSLKQNHRFFLGVGKFDHRWWSFSPKIWTADDGLEERMDVHVGGLWESRAGRDALRGKDWIDVFAVLDDLCFCDVYFKWLYRTSLEIHSNDLLQKHESWEASNVFLVKNKIIFLTWDVMCWWSCAGIPWAKNKYVSGWWNVRVLWFQ